MEELNFIAIFSRDPFPFKENSKEIDRSRIVNKEFATQKECEIWLDDQSKQNALSFWNPQIYNKEKQKYIKP